MSIVVVGSLNMDLVVRTKRHPVPGETLLGSDYETHPGGKGANQAVAAARLVTSATGAGRVRMIGRVGTDEFGSRLKHGLEREGINAHTVLAINTPTGAAFIAVSEAGQNTIIVSPGANGKLRPENLSPVQFNHCLTAVLQLEIPLDTVRRAAELAREAGGKVILNAAPAHNLPEKLLRLVDILVVNETEAQALTGLLPDSVESALEAAQTLQTACPTVVVTLGSQGAVWVSPEGQGHQPAFAVEVRDTTAAGDAFTGALAVATCEAKTTAEAVRMGCAAGALATTRAGAQPSLPERTEVERLLKTGDKQ